MTIRGISVLCLLITLVHSATLAADWPLFRGNHLQTGVASSSLPEKLEILWMFQTPEAIESTAAIVGDTVYIGTVGATDGHLYALNLAEGKEKWKYKTGPIKASPAVKDGFIYVGDMDGMFHCVDAAKGTKVWAFETCGEIIPSANFADDKVLFGSADEYLYCLDAKTGKQVWRFKVPGGPINPSPAVVENRVFAAGCDSTLHIIHVADGKELASVELPAQVGASPAISGHYLYIGDMGQSMVGVDWKKAEIVWKYESEKQLPFYASAAVKDNIVIVGGRDKMVHALDAKTGERKWTFRTRGRVDSSPVIVGDRVFVGSDDGNLYALDLQKGTQVWSHALGAKIRASPAVGRSRLVIGTEDGIIYCFGAK